MLQSNKQTPGERNERVNKRDILFALPSAVNFSCLNVRTRFVPSFLSITCNTTAACFNISTTRHLDVHAQSVHTSRCLVELSQTGKTGRVLSRMVTHIKLALNIWVYTKVYLLH